MSEVNPSLSIEAEVLRQFYDAINRFDIPALINLCDPEIVRIEPDEYPQGGTYYGHEAVAEHLTKGRGSWAEGSCEPERLFVAGDRIVAFIHVHVRLKDHSEWIDGDLADVLTFRNGKVIEFRTIDDQQDALKWAGIE